MAMADEPGRASVSMTEVITEILPNDVLLGRGALAIGNIGNVSFRSIIKERQAEYVSTSRRKKKDIIAAGIRLEIARRNGRFLRRVETGNEMLALGIGSGVKKAWVRADESNVMQKIKQSLRDGDESDGVETKGGSVKVARVDGDSSDSKQVPHKKPKVFSGMAKGKTAHEAPQSASILPTRDHHIWETQNSNQSELPLEGRHHGIFASGPSVVFPQSTNLSEPLAGQVGMRSQLQSPSSVHSNPHHQLESLWKRQNLMQQLEHDRAATFERLRGQELLLSVLRSAEVRSQCGHYGQDGGRVNNLRGQQSSSSASNLLRTETLAMTAPSATSRPATGIFAPSHGTDQGLGLPPLSNMFHPSMATTIGNPLLGNPSRLSPQSEEQRSQMRLSLQHLEFLERLIGPNARSSQQQPPGQSSARRGDTV